MIDDYAGIAALLTALGAGGAFTALLNRWLSRRERRISEDANMRVELRADLDKTRTRLDAIETYNDTLIRDNAKLEGQVVVLSEQVKLLQSTIDRSSTDISRIIAENRQLTNDIRRLERDNIRLSHELNRVTEENIRFATGIAQLREENRILRDALRAHGINPPQFAENAISSISVITPARMVIGESTSGASPTIRTSAGSTDLLGSTGTVPDSSTSAE